MANGDIYEVNFHMHHVDQRGIIRRFYQVTNTSGTGPTETQIGARFDTAFPPLFKALMTSGAVYKGVKIAKVYPGFRLRGFIVTTSVGPGTVAGDTLPTQTRGIITLRTAYAGPGYRGRSYMPFPCEVDNGPTGAPIAGYVTRLTTLASQLVLTQGAIGTAPNQADFIPIIWHLPKDTPNLPANRIPYAVTEAIARTRWATQRRSGAYGRLNVDEIA